jgi:hypothetical protein
VTQQYSGGGGRDGCRHAGAVRGSDVENPPLLNGCSLAVTRFRQVLRVTEASGAFCFGKTHAFFNFPATT